MQASDLLTQGDAVSRTVAWVLLLMSVASWVVILWKTWLLRRVQGDVARATASFWQASTLTEARQRAAGFDREGIVAPLLDAMAESPAGTLDVQADASARITRLLRDALHRSLQRLQAGQVLLATVGSTAPFVGLLGTVWGIYHALTGLSAGGGVTIDRIAGPVGEALIVTAAGLAVAIPAVVAYNGLGRAIGRVEAELEGFAHDLRAWRLGLSPSGHGSAQAAAAD